MPEISVRLSPAEWSATVDPVSDASATLIAPVEHGAVLMTSEPGAVLYQRRADAVMVSETRSRYTAVLLASPPPSGPLYPRPGLYPRPDLYPRGA